MACTTIERAMVHGEIDIRNDLRHPNLLQLHEAFETHGEMAFILELYDQLIPLTRLFYYAWFTPPTRTRQDCPVLSMWVV